MCIRDSFAQTPPYLWFRCKRAEVLERYRDDKNKSSLGKMLYEYGMKARPGEYFGAGQEDHARISLYVASSTFELFMGKMRKMFADADAI